MAGNWISANEKKTGCLLCFDSCPVGIVSNAQYTYGAIEKRNEVTMKGNKDILPADGTKVIVTLKLI
jgi:Fe-S-cluster-containing hydrogenase component 2